MSLKNGDNSIIIVGAANAHHDPDMKDLDPTWRQTIVNSITFLFSLHYGLRQDIGFAKRDPRIR